MDAKIKYAATWTAYPSLLVTLPSTKHCFLEAVAEARQCGRHNDAHKTFKDSLPNPKSLPILAFEYADLLTDQGMEGDRAVFLEEAGRHLQPADGSSERRLLDLMLADAQLWAYGSLRNAVEVARRSRSWLGGDPDEQFSDLRIRGIQLYHQLMQRGFRDSNWVSRSELTAFEAFDGNVSTECAALSLSLRNQGHSAAAARMMVEQLSETDPTSLPALCQDVAAFCDELEATDLPALMCRSAYTKFSVAKYAPGRSVDLVAQCRAAAAQLPGLAAVFSTDYMAFFPKLSTRLQMHELTESSAAPAEITAELAILADQSIDCGDYSTANLALNGAASASEKAANQDADKGSANLLKKYLTRLLDLHRQRTKSLYFEAEILIQLLLVADVKTKSHEDILDEVAKFSGRAPLFDVPVLRERLYQGAMTAAREAGREDLLETYDREHNKAFRESLPEDLVPTGIVQVIAKIQNEAHNALDCGKHAVHIALIWAREEYQSDKMSQLDWEDLFGFYILKAPERQRSPAFSDYLECVEREYLNFSIAFFDATREDWTVRFRKLRGWLMESKDNLPADSRLRVLITIAQAWGFKQRADWMKQPHTDEENAGFMPHMLADMALVNELQAINKAQASSVVGLPANIGKKDESVFRVLGRIKSASADLTAEALDQAIQDSEDVYQEYHKRQNYLGMFTALMQQAEFLWNKYTLFKTASPEDAIAVLSHAETVYDDVRRKRSVPLAHHYSIAGKMRQLRKYNASDIYNKGICWSRIAWGVHLASLEEFQKAVNAEEEELAGEERQARLKLLDTALREARSTFVSWTQKSKGRAILDLLSIESPITPSLLEECNRSLPAAEMIQRERELVQRLAQTPFPQLVDVREELDALRGAMRQHPLLKDVMSIRDGETINLRGITEMLQGWPDGIVVVDFIYVEFDKPLRALCYRKGFTYSPALIQDVSMDTLAKWTKNLKKSSKKPLGDVSAGKESLAELTPLLLPLFKVGTASPNQNLGRVIRPGETIVFCATGVMHKLPLHAIPIDGVPVIEQHPVVYCPSLTVLRRCFQMTQTQRDHHSDPKSLVLNPMPSHWDKAKSTPVQSTPAVKRLAKTLGAEYLHGCDFTKQSIMNSLDGISIFHYHGHVQFETGSALKSYMVLSEVGEGTDADADDDGPPGEKRLMAEDVFSCRLAKGALATLVGCQSGGADVSAADDALGIPMALYYAGASATVSSLWRLDDEDGGAWADAFYGDLRAQASGEEKASREKKVSIVNLALAMQQAVRSLRFDAHGQEMAPYHWAGYVLSGSWKFPFALTSVSESG